MGKCKHDWVKITNINKTGGAFLWLLIWSKDYIRKEKYVWLKCGKEIR